MRGAKQKEIFEISDLRREFVRLSPRGRRLRLFFGFKILSFNIFGGFEKTEIFWGI